MARHEEPGGRKPDQPAEEQKRLHPIEEGEAQENTGKSGVGHDHERSYVLATLEEVPGTSPQLFHDPKYPDKAWRKVPRTKNRYEPAFPGEAPQVRAFVSDENGEEGRIAYYEIELGGKVVTCSHDELTRGAVWERFAGGSTLGSSGSRNASTLANYIQHLAQKAPKYTGHRSTGWQDFEDGTGEKRFGYVLPDGRVLCAGAGENPAVRMVGMPEDLRKPYETINVPAQASKEDVREALDFVLLATPRRGQLLSALGAAARGLTYGIERAGFTVILEGERGTGKTSAAAVARSLIAPYLWPPNPEMSFSDTENALEHKVSRLGSYPALVDDLAIPPGATAKTVNDVERKIDRLVRSNYNDAGMRGRMRRDMTERPSRKVGTVPIITAEKLPAALQSMFRRVLLLPLEEDEANLDLLKESKRYAPALMALGHRVILMLSRRIEAHGREHVAGELRDARQRHTSRLREALESELGRELPQMCESLPEIGSEVLVGLRLLKVAAGLRDGELTEDGIGYLSLTLSAQVERMEGRDDEQREGPFTRLMGKLAESFRAGLPITSTGAQPVRSVRREPGADGPERAPMMKVPGTTESVPAHVWGFGDEDEGSYRKPVTVAFVDEEAGILYLTDTAREALLSWAAKTPGCQHLDSERALGSSAEKEGWIRRTESKRQRTVKPRHRGDNKGRALAVCAWRFVGAEKPGEGPESHDTPLGRPSKSEPDLFQAPEIPPFPGEQEATVENGTPGPEREEKTEIQEEELEEPATEIPVPGEAITASEEGPGEEPEWWERAREILREPWATKQAALCRRPGGDRLINPLANSVSGKLFGSPHRWREVLPMVEQVLGEE